MSENKNAKTPADGPAANRAMTLEEVQQWITTTWLRCQDEVWRQLPTKHMSREAMKQPEALRLADALDHEFAQGRISNYIGRKAAAELRRLHEALETEQEPVAFINAEKQKLEWAKLTSWHTPTIVNLPKIPLYTAPPKREWVGLTLNEAEDFYEKYTDKAELINAIDKFLEEKNT